MTRRERAIARLQRRREWAEGRRTKATACFAVGDPYRGDVAFNTQPGHIPERARVIRAADRGVNHLNMADHHESKAGGIARQLETSIYSDDPDAIDALQNKIDQGRATLEQMKAANKIVRKYKDDPSNGARELEQIGIGSAQAPKLFVPDFCGRIGFASYQLTNLGANIRRLQKRIEIIKNRQQTAAEAADNGGVIIKGGDYVAVTFAEKPEREVLDDLRAAGFHWSGGSWCGHREAIPDSVLRLMPV